MGVSANMSEEDMPWIVGAEQAYGLIRYLLIIVPCMIAGLGNAVRVIRLGILTGMITLLLSSLRYRIRSEQKD
jgi:hypothetical protein